MNTVNKTFLVCFGLALATINVTTVHASEAEKKKEAVQNEPLALGDTAYITAFGYESFYKNHFYPISNGKKKTFLEEWMQYGMRKNLVSDIYEANRIAIAFKISLNDQITQQAANLIEKDMKDGIYFLKATRKPAEVQEFIKSLQTISELR
jgi:hypothetical protein